MKNLNIIEVKNNIQEKLPKKGGLRSLQIQGQETWRGECFFWGGGGVDTTMNTTKAQIIEVKTDKLIPIYLAKNCEEHVVLKNKCS